jgi:hypothetical protein
MFVENLCSPAVLYLGFSLTQIIIDLLKKMYNTALVKTAVAVVFTTVLNILCSRGLTTISWFIVFIPFVTMSFVTGILMYLFGLAPFTGKLDYSTLINGKEPPKNPAVDRGDGPKEQSPDKQPVSTQPADDSCNKSAPSASGSKTSGEAAVNCAKSKSTAENIFVTMKHNIEAFGNNNFMSY